MEVKKLVLFCSVMFFIVTFNSYGQKLELLKGIEYQIDTTNWISIEKSTVKTPYKSEYVLKNVKEESTAIIRLNVVDYHLKDSLYSGLTIKKRTIENQIAEVKKAFSSKFEGKATLTFKDFGTYKGFGLLAIEMRPIGNDSLKYVIGIGLKVIDDYLIVSTSVENIIDLSQKQTVKLLKSHLARMKYSS